MFGLLVYLLLSCESEIDVMTVERYFQSILSVKKMNSLILKGNCMTFETKSLYAFFIEPDMLLLASFCQSS
jgi:hypothetical protein